MKLAKEVQEAVLHLFFPHVCEGCGSDGLNDSDAVCIKCLASLPETNFHLYAANPVEKIFRGRLPLTSAFSLYYFTKGSIVQELMHAFKYRSNKELGYFLGQQLGLALKSSNRFSSVEALLPLPLFRDKEKRRGFNQATILCEGIASQLRLPIHEHLLRRTADTESQTFKGRMERWQNMEGRFELKEPAVLENRHVLLVDDVITTGATLEACGNCLLGVPGLQLSIATLCFSSGN